MDVITVKYKTHFSRQLNCWSLRCSWSIACRRRRCSNYIFILNLTPGFNGLGKDKYKMRREAFKFWDLVQLILETLRYICISTPLSRCWVYLTSVCKRGPCMVITLELILELPQSIETARYLIIMTSSNWNIFRVTVPFVRGIHRSQVDYTWREVLIYSLICAWTNGWANNRDACDLRCHSVHYDAIVMITEIVL